MLKIIDSTISSNYSGLHGGGILTEAYNGGLATVEIHTSTIVGNSANSYYGGGIWSFAHYRGTSTVEIVNSAISGNSAGGAGGGIWNRVYDNPAKAVVTVKGSTISDNNSSTYGGAIWSAAGLDTTSSVEIVNSTLSRNTAFSGGGIYNGGEGGSAVLIVTASTVTSNTASGGNGGGVFVSPGAMIVSKNTILAGNLATSKPDCDGIFNSGDFNLIGKTNGATVIGATAHNIYDQDPVLGPLADYGGPTPTMPLLAGSPAIDGGGTADCLPTDQRGRVRPYGAACDIGAFESSPPYVIRGTLSGFTLTEPVTVLTSPGNPLIANRGPYSIEGLSQNTYTVTPWSVNYHFVPTNRLVPVGPDQLGVNFKAYRWNALSMEGISNGMLHLIYAGTNGESVRTLASSNLVDWTPIFTNTVPSTNLFDIFDPTSRSRRFYRTAKP